MEIQEKPFLTGSSPAVPLPLARYLPLLPPGMVTRWLESGPPRGSWLLDPFGAHPFLALEAARAGYRVLVASNNPILSFMLEVMANAPQKDSFEAALAALAASRRGEERLERHLESLYLTGCVSCSQLVQAQAFIWQRDQPHPIARIYRCPACGDEGERPITQADIDRLSLPGNDAMHRSRALARVIQDNAGDQRELVEEALKTYLPRPLYVLTTLINKTETLSLPADRKQLLTALWISVCDEANTLWQHPSVRPRPRLLTIPTQFRENNLWLAVENAIPSWIAQSGPVPIVRWPELPGPDGGISLYHGRIKSLLPLPEALQPAAIVTMVPRPNQAFWTLCALWSGWIWGREAVQPLQSALERRRYDWYWMTHALEATLTSVNRQLSEGTPLFASASELIPGYLLSLFIGPHAAGFTQQGLAFEPEQDIVQFWWRSSRAPAAPSKTNIRTVIQQAVRAHLLQRGEPAGYLVLFSVVLRALSSAGLLPLQIKEVSPDFLGRTQAVLAEILENRAEWLRYPGRSQAEESSLWWLVNPQDSQAPLADRVEKEIVSQLIEHQQMTSVEIDQIINNQFPGLLTPPQDLIRACLQSYAEPAGGQGQVWRLRAEDAPAERRADLKAARKLLAEIGARLGYLVNDEDILRWVEPNGKDAYHFFILASSMVSRFVLQPQPLPPRKCVLVLPGGRASLLSLKMRRDPHLNQAIESGWRVLKYRHLRQLASRRGLTLNLWEELLDGDPPSWDEATQMTMF